MAFNRYYASESYDGINAKCVFISHQRKDKTVAKAIADYILKAGVDVYFDEYDTSIDINNPKSVVTSIQNGIRRSTHMLCLLSNNAMQSKWMPWEIGYGYDRTDLVGLTVKEISESILPEYLQVIPILRGTKSLNEFLSRVCGISTSQMINENRMTAYCAMSHPLDDYLNWQV